MDLSLREISYFLKVAELGSLGTASAALSLSQPALSRSLKRLEDRLGGALFVRHTQGMDLTAFGEAFLPHARILQADANRAVEDLNLLRGAARGVARVGMLPSASVYLLPRVFAAALTRAPDIQIHVVEASSRQLVADLEHGHIDFAVASALPAQDSETISASCLLREQMFVIARPGHPAAAGACGLGELRNWPWIMPERGNALLLEVRRMFLAAGVEPPEPNVSANSMNTLKLTVASSDFLTALPAMAFRQEQQMGLLEPVGRHLPPMSRDLSILRRAARPLLPAAALVLAELRKAVAEAMAEVDAILAPERAFAG